MALAIYITHPEVIIDPAIPTPHWGLSDKGRARAEAFAGRGFFVSGTHFYSSTETKAIELAQILAAPCQGQITTHAEMGENDRSSTGFLDPVAFEIQADRLFAEPDVSADGWETARDAQTRIVQAIDVACRNHSGPTPIVFTGHGCVGTLLKCHIAGRQIARNEDQGRMAHAGGGNCFAFDLAANRLICDWTPMEKWLGEFS